MRWRDKIIAENCSTIGAVTKIEKSKWLKDHPESTIPFPRKVLYCYSIEEVDYQGYHYISWNAPCPQIGDEIKVYYQAAAPHRNAAVMAWEEEEK